VHVIKLLLEKTEKVRPLPWVIEGGKAAIGEDLGTRYVPTFITVIAETGPS
jgi:hypothetical protein